MQLPNKFLKITRFFFLSSFFLQGSITRPPIKLRFSSFRFLSLYPREHNRHLQTRALYAREEHREGRGEKDFPDTSNSIGVESFRWKPLVELWNIFQTSRGSSKLLASGFPWFRGSTFHQKAMMEPWKHRSSLTIGRWKLLSYIRVRHPAREVC